LLAFCIGSLATGHAALSADDARPKLPASEGARTDQDLDSLLLAVERQLSLGQVVLPRGDNALETWKDVIGKAFSDHADPRVVGALREFEAKERQQAEIAKGQGKHEEADQPAMFAASAADLVASIERLNSAMLSPRIDPGSASGVAAPTRPGETAEPEHASSANESVSRAASVTPPVGQRDQSAPTDVPSRRPELEASITPSTHPGARNPEIVVPSGQMSLAQLLSRGPDAPENSVAPAAPAAKKTEVVAPSPASRSNQVAAVAPPMPGENPLRGSDASENSVPPAKPAGKEMEVAAPRPASPSNQIAAVSPVAPAENLSRGSEGPDRSAVPAELVAKETDIATPRPASAGNQIAAVPPTQPAPPRATPPSAADQKMSTFYAARGDEMLARKDLSAARKFYEFAAGLGNAAAATALARTYDAAFVDRLGIVGHPSDPALAAAWYRKAAELGGPPAREERITQTAAGVK
jgi:hypothetical protein